MEELILKLESRAKAALYNPNEVTEAVLLAAMTEALELTENKPIPEPMVIDLAILRLKMILKVEPSEFDMKLGSDAIKAATRMKIMDDGSGAPSCYAFGGREGGVW